MDKWFHNMCVPRDQVQPHLGTALFSNKVSNTLSGKAYEFRDNNNKCSLEGWSVSSMARLIHLYWLCSELVLVATSISRSMLPFINQCVRLHNIY